MILMATSTLKTACPLFVVQIITQLLEDFLPFCQGFSRLYEDG
jgi:hypothetical protein